MLGGSGVGGNRRGASEVLGAIFVFAILIAAVGVFQVTIVPQTNEEIEFKHSTQVRSDVAGLRAAMVSTATDGGWRTVSVTTGVDYPSRSVTINPSGPRGRLSTSGAVTGAIELHNAVATDPEAADYWDGSVGRGTFDTTFVAYHPAYNYYRGAPVTRYEPTVVYSSFADADVVETPQSLVDGRTLNVVLVSGSLSKSGGASETVDVVPISHSGRPVTVTDPGPLVVQTYLSGSAWNRTLDGEPNASVASYTNNTDAPNEVEISLASGTWDLRVSKVGLDSGGSTSAAYLTAEGPRSRTVDAGESVDYTVRAFDAYGNPVSGVTVRRDGGASATTDGDGRVTFEISPTTDTTESVWIGSSKPASGGSPERVDFDFDLPIGNSQEINPGSGLVMTGVSGLDTGPNDGEVMYARFRNDAASSITITDVRFNFYSPDGEGATGSIPPSRMESNRTDTAAAIGGGYVPIGGGGLTISDTDTVGFEFRFRDPDSYDGGEKDFAVITFRFSDGTSQFYFMTPGFGGL